MSHEIHELTIGDLATVSGGDKASNEAPVRAGDADPGKLGDVVQVKTLKSAPFDPVTVHF